MSQTEVCMNQRKNLCTENFRRALELREDPRKFIELVSRLLGASGNELRAWANTATSEDELTSKINGILEKGGVCDEWVFLWTVCGQPTDPQDSGSCGSSSIATGNDSASVRGTASDQEPPEESSIRLIGAQIQSIADTLISTIASTIVANGSKLIIIHGGPMSGKTTLIRRISDKLRLERGIPASNYRDLTSLGVYTALDLTRVIYLDDADMESISQTVETQMIKYYRSRSHVLVFTCRDISRLNNIVNACDGMVVELPLPSDDELVEIISHLVIRGYALSLGTSRKIVNLLNAFGVQDRMPKAIDTMRMMLYPQLYADFRKGTIKMGRQELDFKRGNVEAAVSHVLGIKVMSATGETDKQLSDSITERIKGQEDVVNTIIPSLTSIASGMTDPTKPAGVMLFYGPTGSGKTEMAKVIADVMFNGVFHKEEMNTYSEKHSVSRITGAPPGYIGYGDVPAMIEFLDAHRRGVLLLDEIEKAHETVADHIMELLDTGMIRDTKGKKHDARGFLIIMTSNVMFEHNKANPIGFGTGTDSTVESPRDELKRSRVFRDEFLGRVQTVAKFKALADEDIQHIAQLMLSDLEKRLLSVGVRVWQKDTLLEDIIKSYDSKTGARSMKNFTETHIKNRVLERGRKS